MIGIDRIRIGGAVCGPQGEHLGHLCASRLVPWKEWVWLPYGVCAFNLIFKFSAVDKA